MLSPEAAYPYPGSYALFIDRDLPESQQQAELVRINWRREGFVMVSFPLRDGASGNKTVAFADLIDGTPLTTAEAHEFHDLDRHLAGRSLGGAVGPDGRPTRRLTTKQKRDKARRDTLHQRILWAVLRRKLLDARRRAETRKVAA